MLNLIKILDLFGVITIDSRHSHFIDTGCILSFRTPTPETKAAFDQYFQDGMTPAAAIAYHDSMFDVAEVATNSNEPQMDRAAEERMQVDRADGSINPKRRTIYHWHNKCRSKILGKHFKFYSDI